MAYAAPPFASPNVHRAVASPTSKSSQYAWPWFRGLGAKGRRVVGDAEHARAPGAQTREAEDRPARPHHQPPRRVSPATELAAPGATTSPAPDGARGATR